MEKRTLHSPDLTARNIEKIAELFPSVITESRDSKGNVTTAVDFDLLRQELSDHIVEGPQERYQLDWPGKRAAAFAANAPIAKTLRPVRAESVDFDTTKNLFIEGDNLDALKLLQESYLGKVKLIYIDPPYNTGGDFIYDDDFAESVDDFLARSCQSDETGTRLVANSDSNGRYHSDWLSMMYPRLRLARNLLSDDGLIAISIDDHEIGALRQLADQVFGTSNFIATVIWHKMDSPKNSARHLSEDHEYLLLFARNADIWRPNLLPRTGDMVARYKNLDDDPRGPWLLGDMAARNPYDQGQYSITTPSGRVIEGPPPGSYWRISKSRFDQLDADDRIWWGDGSVRPGIKRFLSEVRDGVIPQTYWHWKEVGSTRNSKQELHKLMGASSGENLFVTPKPVRLISRLLQIATDSDSVVLDFFAGSGTTADAVLRANAADRGTRSFIEVQVAEDMPDGGQYSTVADLARKRIQKVCNEVLESGTVSGDLGFRAFQVDSTSMTDVLRPTDGVDQDLLGALEASIKSDRSGEDLLFQLLLDWGLELTLPMVREDIDGCEVFAVDDDALIACFAESVSSDVVRAIAARRPLRAVFRDDAFASDAARINAEQIFKELSPTGTEVRTI
ncbi:site-specific DNA-methyltransferase [Specibacter cremeus]|uniref:site-specific DNA-methyltransferase n=1 Tax=Specibacter cremeus TaxID=1629051 RepID=UPI000F7904E3|nr:site-specific DNA-methyltransferase [Specibacter cremeus]